MNVQLYQAIAKIKNICSSLIVEVREWAYVFWVKLSGKRPTLVSKKMISTKKEGHRVYDVVIPSGIDAVSFKNILANIHISDDNHLCIRGRKVDSDFSSNFDEDGYMIGYDPDLDRRVTFHEYREMFPVESVELTPQELTSIKNRVDAFNKNACYNIQYVEKTTYRHEPDFGDSDNAKTVVTEKTVRVAIDGDTGLPTDKSAPLDLSKEIQDAKAQKNSRAIRDKLLALLCVEHWEVVKLVAEQEGLI